jgi:hypothetical protein
MPALTPRCNIYAAHDLFRKPVPIFRDHALALPPDRRQCDRISYGLINLANVLTVQGAINPPAARELQQRASRGRFAKQRFGNKR